MLNRILIKITSDEVIDCAHKIMKIMENCIGIENKISNFDLYEKIFKKEYEPDMQKRTSEQFYNSELIKKAKNWLKKKSYCFIVFSREGNIFYSFIAKKKGEDKEYRNLLKSNIEGCQKNIVKSKKAIKEQWCFKEQWVDKKAFIKTKVIIQNKLTSKESKEVR
jgi:hypothetical protein